MFGAGGHWIKPNEACRIPRRHVIVDAEARRDLSRPGVEVQSWRCAVAEFCELTDDGRWRVRTAEYKDPADLWADVEAFTRPKRRTVLWAHNIAYDLRITSALRHLADRGFELADIRVTSPGTWARWRKGDRGLVATDSMSVWPCSLEALGAAFGLGKPALPAGDDPVEWLDRCRADVRILGTAVRAYLDWLRADDMGNWQVTGAGQAFGAWRHKHMTHKVLVADDLGARDAERRAMWTGRCEAYVHGEDRSARVFDYDFTNAYARIARDVDLPVRQAGTLHGVPLERLVKLSKGHRVLAEVQVDTEVPVVPTEHEGRIVWPVGAFSTVLWDPELALLAETGASVTVGRVWLYRKAPALRAWATWILGELAAPDVRVPAWRKIVLKHWSRALIGRFAMRYRSWEEIGTSEADDLRMFDGSDGDTGERVTYLQVGRRVLAPTAEQDSHNAVPAVTGYVMSEARARLWRAVQAVGAEHVLYVDTDSMLLTTAGHTRVRQLGDDPRLAGLRCKRKYTGWQIGGPRQVVLGTEPRISGVPRAATQTGPWRFDGAVWQSLGRAILLGTADTVRVTSRVFTVHQVDNRRCRGPDGTTVPVRLHEEVRDG